MLRRPHQNRLLDIQRGDIVKKRLLIFCRVLLNTHPRKRRIVDDLVIDVGDVHHVPYLVAALSKKTPQNIHRNERP